MTTRDQLIWGDDWAIRSDPESELERVRIVAIADVPLRVEVEFVYRANEREWVSADKLEFEWEQLSAQERDRIATSWLGVRRRESEGTLLVMALALLADAGMADEAWRIYKRYHPAAFTAS